MAVLIPFMDETTVANEGDLRDGFIGQRMVVVPRPVARASMSRPVTRRLLVTDAGFFPHALRHGRRRDKGAGQHIFMLCTDGSGAVQLPEGTLSVAKGDVVLIPAGTPHEYHASADDPWTIWWFHLTGEDADELLDSAYESSLGAITHLRDPAPIASLVLQIIDALDTTTSGGLKKASGAAWYAMSQVIATGKRPPGPSRNPVEQAVDHLRATSPKRTSVDELAAMVGLSASQFGALFKQQLGVPPLRFQNDLRMAKARELLDSSDLPIAQIAITCGFEDALYFSRQFAKTHGESPSAYRARFL